VRFVSVFLAVLFTSSAFCVSAHARVSPDLHEMSDWGGHARTAKTTLILLQLAAMLIAAKLIGRATERFKVPGVIGELLGGMVLGPYVLGQLIPIPLGSGHVVPLFPAPTSNAQWPINEVVWTMGQIASVVLLFSTGLHTDLRQFVRHARSATIVAVAGVVLPMGLGALVVLIPPFTRLAAAHSGGSALVPALFVGAILAATSIGITARVLGDLKKLDTAEGVTILGAAVIDDVLGIIALTIVGGIASGGSVSAGAVTLVAVKAFGFWIGLTVLVLLLSGAFERFVERLNYSGATVGLGLAMALLASGAAEGAGLAFIIGAYSAGLGLSQRPKLAKKLLEKLQPLEAFFVPIFFTSLGMLVNLGSMFAGWPVIGFGVVVTLAAVVGKVVGCGGAARLAGFNAHRAYRVGIGMLPRGEVALIVAGVGLSSGFIGEVVFGVSIMMTLVTTVLAPILLVRAFDAEERIDEVLNEPTAA
jgi:Kef-type K+ transport system membrane component KefB